MKIAISTDSGRVSAHFSRCPQFTIGEIEDDQIKSKDVIDNPGHRTGFLPKFFNEKGIDCVIAGGAGRRAQSFFNQFGIDLIVGISGDIDSVIKEFIQGDLKKGKSMCAPGKGKGYGVEKEDGHHH